MKRFLCLLIVVGMLFLLSVPAFADAAPPGPGDIVSGGLPFTIICLLVVAALVAGVAALIVAVNHRKRK